MCFGNFVSGPIRGIDSIFGLLKETGQQRVKLFDVITIIAFAVNITIKYCGD